MATSDNAANQIERARSPLRPTSNQSKTDMRSLKETNPLKYNAAIYDLYYKRTGEDADNADIFRCVECNTAVKKGKGGQTNLKKHIERRHAEIYKEKLKTLPKDNMQRLDGFLKRTSEQQKKTEKSSALAVAEESAFGQQYYYKKDSDRYKECKRSLAQMICSDIQPFSIVDNPGFLQYSFPLDPKFLVPSRNTVDNEVKVLYEQTKADIISKMQNDVSWYCITFDIWTSRAQDAYISLTVHYIGNKSWQLNDLRLGAYPFQGRHSAEDIASKIKELLEEWQLPIEKLSAVTCDNASNNIKCLTEHFDVPRAPCLGHVLNLSVQDALKVRGISEAIARCRKVVEHFVKSRSSLEALKVKQEELQIKKHKLIQDVPTRWNSTYSMIERLLEQKEAVMSVIKESVPHQNAPLPSFTPTVAEWKVIAQVLPLLRPFYDVTTWISASSYVTISAASPSIAVLKQTLKFSTNDTTPVRKLKETAMEKIGKYFTDTAEEDFLDVCAFIDPRFRAFQHKPENKGAVEDKVCELLTHEISNDNGMESYNAEAAENQSTTDETMNNSGLHRLFSPLLGTSQSSSTITDGQDSPRDIALREIGRYSALPIANINANPLDWWRLYETSLPLLSKIAMKLLCVVATSVPSECLFSIAGEIVSLNDQNYCQKLQNHCVYCMTI